MVELREHVNRLQQENEHLRTRLETNRAQNSLAAAHPMPQTQPNKGKEPALPDHSDPLADDELSFGSSTLPHHSPPQNNAEAESRKRPLRRSSRSVSGAHRGVRREARRHRHHSKLALEYMHARLGGMASQFLPAQHPFGEPPVQHMASFTAIQGSQNMLSSPLG